MKALGHSWVGRRLLVTFCLSMPLSLPSCSKRFLSGVYFGRQILIFATTGFFIKCSAPWYTFFAKWFPFIFQLVWNQGANLVLWKFTWIPNLPPSRVVLLNKPRGIRYSRSFLAEPKAALGQKGCVIHKGIQPWDSSSCCCLPPEFPEQATRTLWSILPSWAHWGISSKAQTQALFTFHPHCSCA